jgi:WD40 repeat protein
VNSAPFFLYIYILIEPQIRVTRFPDLLEIESFCLAHKEFISRLCLPYRHPEILISAGGDHTLKAWDFVKGQLLHTITLFKSPRAQQTSVEQSVAGNGDKSDEHDDAVSVIASDSTSDFLAISFELTNEVVILKVGWLCFLCFPHHLNFYSDPLFKSTLQTPTV